jgi:hypothetical protein
MADDLSSLTTSTKLREAKEIAAELVEILKDLGYSSEVNATELSVGFKRDTLWFVLLPDSDDSAYIRLVVPNVYFLKDASDKLKALTAMAVISGKVKAAKLCLVGDAIHCAVELWSPNKEITKALLPRMIKCCTLACIEFTKELGLTK